MQGSPVGFLSKEDPLYGYLQHQIAPQSGIYSPDADYRVFRFNESRDVYLYAEERLGIKWVGKFFKSPDPVQGRIKGEREFNNLTFLRDMGFSSPPHYVVRPLGFNPAIDNVLVVEYLSGDLLSRIINDALYLDRRDRLFRKLSALASFLAALHNQTARDDTVDFDENYHYMGRLVASLIELQGFKKDDPDTFRAIREGWRSRSCMWEDRNVIVHGDTTPSNFLFGRGNQVMS